MKKEKLEKKSLAWCECTKGLSTVEWMLKTEGKRKIFKKLGGDIGKNKMMRDVFDDTGTGVQVKGVYTNRVWI